MIKVFFAILILSWGAGLYFRSDRHETPKPRVSVVDAANAVFNEGNEGTTPVAAPDNASEPPQASGDSPAVPPEKAAAIPSAAAPASSASSSAPAEARTLEQAARAIVSASTANPSPSPSSPSARAPASVRGGGVVANPFHAPDARAVEYIPLEELLKSGADPRWQIAEAGNDQAVRLFRGETPFIDRSPYYFVPPVADLEQACPPLASLKINAVLRFDLDGKLAEIVAADDKMAAIARDVFSCQLPPRQLRGEAIPFKTLFVPRASR